mgnify:CR=1 FL=1
MKPTRRRELLLSLLFYTALFVAFNWPLAAHFGAAYPGHDGNDANIYVWNAYNFRQAVASGSNPFATTLLNYPRGLSLIMHAYTPVIGLLNVLLRDEILAVNLALALSYVLSGVGAYRLTRRWVSNPVLCLLAGLIFAFSPYKLARLPEHYNLLLTATVPFYLYAFLEAFDFTGGGFWPRVRRWRQVVWCAVLGVVTLLSDYYVLFGLIYFSLGFAAYYWLGLGRINWRRPRPWLVLVVGLVLCHIASRMLKLGGVPDHGGFWWGGDLAGYLVPPPGSRWLSSPAANAVYNSAIFNMPGAVENIVFLGYVLPLLTLAVLLGLRRYSPLGADARHGGQALPWLTLLFFMFTLPAVRVFGKEIWRLPTGLMHYIPFINNIRCPTRYVLFVSLLLPIVVFAALDPWLRGRGAGLRLAVSLLLLLLIGLEYQPKATPLLYAADEPAAYQQAARLPGQTIVPIPFGLLDGSNEVGRFNGNDLFYQTRHHKKMPGGYISRVPEAEFAAFTQDSVIRTLILLQEHPDTTLARPSAAAVRRFLCTYEPAAFIVAPAFRNTAVDRYLRQTMPAQGYDAQEVQGYGLLGRRGRLTAPAAGAQ